MRLLIFGLGFVGKTVARRALARGWAVTATTRGASLPAGIEPVAPDVAGDAAARSDAVLITAAPDDHGCPGLNAMARGLRGAAVRWIGYLSTTGVYGDWEGRWVFEDSPLNAHSPEGARRAAAEHDWHALGEQTGLPVAAFRLPGIYGPGRSPFDRLRKGQARSIDRPGQVFSRIHVEDIAAGVEASMRRPRRGAAYNLVDDEPAPAHVVTAHAAALLGVPAPPVEAYDAAMLSPKARRFYEESRRVANALAKAELGWRPAYPTYREGLAAVLAAENR